MTASSACACRMCAPPAGPGASPNPPSAGWVAQNEPAATNPKTRARLRPDRIAELHRGLRRRLAQVREGLRDLGVGAIPQAFRPILHAALAIAVGVDRRADGDAHPLANVSPREPERAFFEQLLGAVERDRQHGHVLAYGGLERAAAERTEGAVGRARALGEDEDRRAATEQALELPLQSRCVVAPRTIDPEVPAGPQ